jgi:ParB family chromosome partitioning protein
MEISLNERLGRRVKVDYGKNKGALILEFYDKEDLAALAEKLTDEE